MGLTGTWEQFKEGKGGANGRGTKFTGLREELLVESQQGREVQMSGGGWRVGEPSRWMVTPRLGEFGERRG